MRRLLPDHVRFVLHVAAASFLLFALLRLVFWYLFAPIPSSAPAADIANALYIGFRFDLRLALIVTLPLALLGWIPVINPSRHRLVRNAWLGYFVVAQFLVVLLYAADFGHYEYLHARLNANAVEHLEPLSIALRVVWETYPVVTVLFGLIAFSAAYLYWLRHIAQRQLANAAPTISKWSRRIAVSAFALLYVVSMFGRWSQYPLRWSDAYFSTNEFVAALGLNPVLFLADTMGDRVERSNEHKVREHYDDIAALLEVKQPDRERLSFVRHVAPRKTVVPEATNIVLIHLESFAAFKVGIFGNGLQATPNFDALARDGILFTHFFVPTPPTARSVFTMVSGLPDYNPGRTASRDPLLVNQYTLINALEDYERYYFLGGSAAWGNIRGILSHNIAGLKVFEEGNYEAARTDGWGVSDIALFEKAHSVLKEERKPFFAFIQTSGNHRPYTIPDDKRGFELADLDDETLRKHGFDGLAAYNGLRFFDYSLGLFFDLARREPYFRNTIFVLYGDHGNPATNDIPWQHLGLTGFHVPLLIYAPAYIKSRQRIDSVASLVDVLPTSLGLMGVPYVNKALGRDLLVPRPPQEHFALISDGLLTDEFLLRARPQGGYNLYRYRSDTPTVEVASRYPQEMEALTQLHGALYETSRYLLSHNKPESVQIRQAGMDK
jgi:phosphoglycerol transferase MdoB-like AlkP superfamily enzyme